MHDIGMYVACSVGILVHPATARIVDLPAEEDPVARHLAGGQELCPCVSLFLLGDYVPWRSHSLVNHPREPHVPETLKLVNCQALAVIPS